MGVCVWGAVGGTKGEANYVHWCYDKKEDNVSGALECSALLVPATGAGVWCCWYVQAENTLRRETHGQSFFWEG